MCTLTRGERFKDARTVHNQHGSQSMDDVYKATGVSASMIKDLEDDEKERSVGYDKIALLAKHYGVSADYLLGLSPYPTTNKDQEFICKYTGLSTESVAYLKHLTDIRNGLIVHPRAYGEIEQIERVMKALGAFVESNESCEKYYKNLCDEYANNGHQRQQDAIAYGVADKNDIEAIAKAKIAYEKNTYDKYREQAITGYQSCAVDPVSALNAILACDQQEEILINLAYFLQIDTSKTHDGRAEIGIKIYKEDGSYGVSSSLPVEAIAWGYLKRVENSLSKLRSKFKTKAFVE